MQVINVGYGCCLIIWIWYECYFFWYEFDMNLMVKKYDFDRVVLFANLVWLKSIDFTGVFSDWWVVNWLVLMCYFIIIYGIFGWVRLNALFSRDWGDFWWNSGDFWWCEKWWNAWFFNVLSKSLPNSEITIDVWIEEICLVCNRTLVLKCKPRPLAWR